MDLAAAVAEYRAAQAALEDSHAAVRTSRDRLAQARADLAAAIVAEAERGERQVDIIRRTGLSRERVRQILREGGIEPD